MNKIYNLDRGKIKEKNLTLEEIGQKSNCTKQSISYFLNNGIKFNSLINFPFLINLLEDEEKIKFQTNWVKKKIEIEFEL